METETGFDKERAKAFMGTMVGMLNGGSLAMMCSIGHRTGLFDRMAGLGPSTSVEIAAVAELDERYVREWLAAMASGGLIDFDANDTTFVLPAEHQTLLTRAGGPLNFANLLQFMSLMGQVEDDVVDAFRTGEGIPYSRYPGFQALMAEDSAARFDVGLLDQMIPNIEGAVDALAEGADLADVGCGHGYALILLAAAYPSSTFTGFDISAEAVTEASRAASDANLTNLRFEQSDAALFDAHEAFDYITTFDAIHDQAQPAQVLSNIYHALRPGGQYLCVEPKAASTLAENMTEPVAAYQYTVSTMHCMSVSIAAGGEGLGTAWGTESTTAFLDAAGFVDIRIAEVRSDRANSHFICRKP